MVASSNPAKISAVEMAFSEAFPKLEFEYMGVEVKSGVADQPMSDEETREGAVKRVQNAMAVQPQADYWVGLEGGVAKIGGKMQSFAWVSVAGKKGINLSRTATFVLPKEVVAMIESGKELGQAMDVMEKRRNTKQQEGAVGILTKGLVSRSELYSQATILALIPFM